jgi:hypothetical protein
MKVASAGRGFFIQHEGAAMSRTDTISWVISVCAVYLRLSQAKTLGVLVASAMRCERVSLANIGRSMLGSAKHQIKRCWRFCANQRVESANAMQGVVKRLIKKRSKPLLVAFDWVDIKGYQTLMASAVLKGRSVPLCWASCRGHTYDGQRSRNAFEESLLLILRSMIPRQMNVILLADRGFGRTALACFCRQQGFHYLIRIQPNVKVKSKDYCGKLLDYPVKKGIARVLKDVLYRSDGFVNQNVVVRWRRDLPKTRDECWFLMTDLSGRAEALAKLYGTRMTIEQLFRDGKNKRNGWSLRDTQLRTPERLDRLLLILAIAYILLCGVGLMARKEHAPGAWCSASKASKKQQCSMFRIGMIMLQKITVSPPKAFAAIFELSEEVAGNWG